MITWLKNKFLGFQLKQVQRIAIAPDEQLMLLFKTDSMDYIDVRAIKSMIQMHLPELSGRVMIIVSSDDVDVKAVAINEYLQKLKQY